MKLKQKNEFFTLLFPRTLSLILPYQDVGSVVSLLKNEKILAVCFPGGLLMDYSQFLFYLNRVENVGLVLRKFLFDKIFLLIFFVIGRIIFFFAGFLVLFQRMVTFLYFFKDGLLQINYYVNYEGVNYIKVEVLY